MVGSTSQPYMYTGTSNRNSGMFPEKPFDPKAVTRMSWEPRPVKPKHEGPLVDINRHPDTHELIGVNRRHYRPMSTMTKWWVKAMRWFQLAMRTLQLIGALAILVLMIIISKQGASTAWVMRVASGYAIVHCVYGIYSHAKPATSKTPASSAAYQIFAAFSDLGILPLYAYGCWSCHQHSGSWQTLLHNKTVLPYLISAFYYLVIVAGSMHVVTLGVSFWLAIQFRRILNMPPDMNPLEESYTTRAKKMVGQHQRNKSSVVTMGTLQSLDSIEDEKLRHVPAVPFMHTRTGSDATQDARRGLPSSRMSGSTTRDSRRNSMATLKRSSGTPSVPTTPTTYGRNSYTDIPLHGNNDDHRASSRRSMGAASSRTKSRPSSQYSSRPVSHASNTSRPTTALSPPVQHSPGRSSNGNNTTTNTTTDNWYASDSLGKRTQQRNAAINNLILGAGTGKRSDYNLVRGGMDGQMMHGDLADGDGDLGDHLDVGRPRDYHNYESLAGYNNNDDDENVVTYGSHGHTLYSNENVTYGNENVVTYGDCNDDDDANHPNPLRSNPLPERTKTPYHHLDANETEAHAEQQTTAATSSMTSAVSSVIEGSILGELHLNDRRVSGGDRGDLGVRASGPPSSAAPSRSPSKRWTWTPRQRDSSIQGDEQFYSKPYGALRSGTPPTLVGKNGETLAIPESLAKCPGNDYETPNDRYLYYGSTTRTPSGTISRRHVSGRAAEEGRAYSRTVC